tara:strand:+ start:9887 stop:11299 length:1413 start_codon:yes stop_codon:yes gene_type:complete
MEKRVYLLMETKKRELDSRCYFAVKSCLKNFSVVLSKKDSFYKNKKHLKPGFVFFKSLGRNYYTEIKKAKKLGFKICAQDEEGLQIFDKEDYLDRRLYYDNLDYLDYIFTWGKRDYEMLSDLPQKIRDNIYITGSPRVDILKNPINSIYAEEAKKIKKKYGNFFLFNTYFTFSNHFFFKDKEKKSLALEAEGSSEKSLIYKRGLQMKEFQSKTMAKSLEFIKDFASKFPNEKLIIRPHPSENHEIWFQTAKKFDNVDCIYDDQNTCSWMMASSFSISSNCTTSIESFLLGKFNYNFRPIIDEKVEFDLPKICGINVETVEKLLNKISIFLDKNTDEKIFTEEYTKKVDKLKNYMANVEEKKCSVDEILNFLSKDKNESIFVKEKYMSRFVLFLNKQIRRIAFYKMRITGVFAKKTKDKIEFAIQKFPDLSESEISAKISNILKKMNIDNNLIVKEIYPGSFLIKANQKKY